MKQQHPLPPWLSQTVATLSAALSPDRALPVVATALALLVLSRLISRATFGPIGALMLVVFVGGVGAALRGHAAAKAKAASPEPARELRGAGDVTESAPARAAAERSSAHTNP